MSDQTFPIWRFVNGHQHANLYYYNGNFFYPIFLASKNLERLVEMKIKAFTKANRELVKSDRAHPDYLTKLQLAEAQGLSSLKAPHSGMEESA